MRQENAWGDPDMVFRGIFLLILSFKCLNIQMSGFLEEITFTSEERLAVQGTRSRYYQKINAFHQQFGACP